MDIDYLQMLMNSKSYKELTPVQKLSFNDILAGKNILVISPTGSGKTEAALWPSLISLKRGKVLETGFKIIYVTPLRALNRDMLKRIEIYGNILGYKVAVRHGDSSESERRYQALHPPDVLITTPETLQIILAGKVINRHLATLRTLIVDEVHELLNDERGYQLLMAISRIRRIRKKFQIIGLSATIGNPDDIGKSLFYPWEFSIINAASEKKYDISVRLNDNVENSFADAIGAEKSYAGVIYEIYKLYSSGRQFIVFTNTRSTAEDLVMRLKLIEPKIEVEVHHGSLGKEIRTSVEERFKLQKLKGIICTSSMELGIDIGTIEHVFQVNSPRQAVRLIQRVGRGKHKLGEVSTGTILAVNEIETEESLAIIRAVMENKIEPVRIRNKPLLVLVNQILGILNQSKKIVVQELYETIKDSYIFKDLQLEELEGLIEFLSSIRMIYYDKDNKILGKTRKTMTYFFENISMIPDEKLYSVREKSSGKLIGFLDEAFVATEIEIGSTFILRGDTWRVINIKETTIYVDYVQGISVPPSWVGEEIPVPFEIARLVQEDRLSGFGKEFTDDYTFDRITKFRKNFPSDNVIIIEKEGNRSIIHLSLGTKGNYTISILISGYLSDKYGESFLVDNTPYTVNIQGNFRYTLDDLHNFFNNMDNIIPRLNDFMTHTRMFQYNFLNVAKKFGIISKDSDLTRIRIEKIIGFYKDTPLYKEAIDRFQWEYLDMEAIRFLSNMITEGKISFDLRQSFSEVSKMFFENLKEKMMPIKPTVPILNAIKKRLQNEELGFYCLSCGRKFYRKISEMEELRCIFCTSPRIAPMKKYELEDLNEITPDIRNRLNNLFHLQRMHGMKSLLVLAGHGIGLETANRILRIPYRNENDLLEKILMSEIEFSKNKRFWS